MRRVSQLRVNGVELDYVDEGTGVPVVFSHGGSSDIRYWEPQRTAFVARYRFVAYSHRFHGAASRSPTSEISADAHAADLVAVMGQLDAGPVHLVGFSTAIALRATLREPRLVRSLTIVEPNVPWLLEGSPDGEAVLGRWRAENERVRTEAGADTEHRAALWFDLVNNSGRGAFDAQPETLRRMWLDNFDRPRAAAAASQPLRCEELSGISAPTLVLAAEHGMPYSRLIAERLTGCIPRSQLMIVPAVTHFMSYQAPQSFNEVVFDFLASVR
jgi:pimeloyl-ACP methyl ester carboxylesterase